MREPDEPRINPTDQPMLEILMSNVDGPQAAAFSGAAPWAGKVGRPGGVDRAATLVDYGDAAMLDIDAMLGTPAAGEPKQRTARAASNGEVVSSPETLADVERTASPSSRTFSDSEDSLGTRNGSSGSGGRWNGANSASASPAEPVPLPVFAIPAPQDFSFPLGVSTVSPGTLDSMPGVYSEGGLSIFAPVPTLPGSPRKIKTPRRGTPGGAAAALASIPAPRPFSPASVAQSSGLAGLAPDVDRESALATLKGQLDAARGVPTLSRSIRVLGVPSIGAKSRVETQIKVCLQLVAPSGSSSDWTQLRIPEHMLASRDRQKRSRAAGSDMDAEQDGILDLQAEVICASEPSRQVMVCATCMQRERKRVRKRTDPAKLDPEETGDDAEARRILLFNINPSVDFSGDVILPSRITCYCRHHNERIGFCLYFTMRDRFGRTVATGISPPVLITDDHKSVSKARTRKRPRTSIVSHSLDGNEEASLFEREGSPGPEEPFVKMEPTDDASFEMATPRTMPMLDPTVHAHEPLPAAAAPRKGKQVVHVLPQGYRTVVDPSAFDGGRVGEAVISKVVPGEGPLHGGVDVTVLGTGFHNGLTVLFGSTPATATQYWNSNTLVVILPPGTTPGPVVVSFKDQQGVVANGDRPLPIFVYKDESERTLMELALQVVGLRLNGRIEDAREVAMRIVGEAAAGSNGSAPTGISPGSISSATLNLAMAFAGRNPMTKDEFEELLLDVFGKARHKARYLLTVNRRGLSLLHLAVLADMPRLVSWLSDEVGGMLVDAADDAVGGWTALMWASWLGRSECAEALLNAGADGFLCDESGRSAWDLAVERGWDTVIDLLEIHGLDETEDEFEASGSEWGDEYESDWASESEYSYSEDGSSIYSEDANEHEADEVQTTMVLPIMAIGAEADVQPAPPGEIPAAPIPLPLANNPSASPIIRPASAARPLEVLEETVLGGPAQTEEEELVVDAVPMEPAGPLPLPPQLARTMQWFHSLTSIGSAVQSIDVGDVARYPFTNMQNPFRHFEIPNAVSGLFRRKAAVKTGEEEKEGEAMAMGAIGVVDAGKNQQQEVAPVSLSVVSWVGQSSGRKAAKGSGSQAADGNGKQVAPVASQRDDVEAEAAPTGAAFTAVVTDDDKAVQGQDYTTLLWFWLPMAVLLATLATLKYFSYTDDLEQFFVDAVDHYLFRLVFGSTQPVLGQDPVPPPDIPYHHAMPAFEAQAPMIAAVG